MWRTCLEPRTNRISIKLGLLGEFLQRSRCSPRMTTHRRPSVQLPGSPWTHRRSMCRPCTPGPGHMLCSTSQRTCTRACACVCVHVRVRFAESAPEPTHAEALETFTIEMTGVGIGKYYQTWQKQAGAGGKGSSWEGTKQGSRERNKNPA